MTEAKSRTPLRPLAAPIIVLLLVTLPVSASPLGDAQATKTMALDARSLHHKVLCGYQGWFRCPGDPAGEGWKHWSRKPDRFAADTVSFEMWPDLTEFDAD